MPELNPEPVPPVQATENEQQADAPREAGRVGIALQLVSRHARQPLVLLGLFAAAYGVFGYQYYKTSQEQDVLAGQIETKRHEAGIPVPGAGDSLTELDQLGKAIDLINSISIPELLDSEIMSQALDAAVANNVEIHMEGTLPSSVEELNGEQYISTPIQLRADGTLSDLQLFLQQLEVRTFETIQIKDTVVNRNDAGYSMTIQAIVYSEPTDGSLLLPQSGPEVAAPGGDPAAKAEVGGAP
jgi:hypothetical protein